MRLSDFDFVLPDDNIALRPAEPRDSARLLVVRPGEDLADHIVRDLPDFLRPGDALVFNDTRVIPARLAGLREARTTGGGDGAPVPVEATLHRRMTPDRWSAFMRPGKRLKVGDRVAFGSRDDRACEGDRLDATVVEKHEGGEALLAFDLSGPDAGRSASPVTATCRCRPTSPPSAPRTSATAPTTRPSMPAKTARWPRLPPACTSRRSCWRH
jgi:S-adenosylmethionine:tRNA ribosyltransferase-isomerase